MSLVIFILNKEAHLAGNIIMANILVVEDELELSNLYLRLFNLCIYTINVVATGKNIDDKILDFKPDVILMDIFLEYEDGRDMCKEIKKTHKNIPVIMVSTSNELKAMSDSSGADDYIEKPFDIQDLMNKVSKWIQIYKQTKTDSTDSFLFYNRNN